MSSQEPTSAAAAPPEKATDTNDSDNNPEHQWALLKCLGATHLHKVSEHVKVIGKGKDVYFCQVCNKETQQSKSSLLTVLPGHYDAMLEHLKSEHSLHWARSPLHNAVLAGNIEDIKRVFQYQGIEDTIGVKFKDGRTPLHDACNIGNVEVAKLLVESGADVNASMEGDGKTPLHLAALKGHLGVIKFLALDAAAKLSFPTTEGYTCLHSVLMAGGKKGADPKNIGAIVEFLLSLPDGKAMKDATATGKWTPLHFASSNGLLDAVVALVQAGAQKNVTTSWSGKTPLLLATEGTSDAHKTIWTFLTTGKLPPPAEESKPAPSSTPTTTTSNCCPGDDNDAPPSATLDEEFIDLVSRCDTFIKKMRSLSTCMPITGLRSEIEKAETKFATLKANQGKKKNNTFDVDATTLFPLYLAMETAADICTSTAEIKYTDSIKGGIKKQRPRLLTKVQRTALFEHSAAAADKELSASPADPHSSPLDPSRHATIINLVQIAAATARTADQLWRAAALLFAIDDSSLHRQRAKVLEALVRQVDAKFLVAKRQQPLPLSSSSAPLSPPPHFNSSCLTSEDFLWLLLSVRTAAKGAHPYEPCIPTQKNYGVQTMEKDLSLVNTMSTLFRLEPICRFIYSNHTPPQHFIAATLQHRSGGADSNVTPWGTPTEKFNISEFFPWLTGQKKRFQKSWANRGARPVDSCIRHQMIVEAQLLHWTLSSMTHPQPLCNDVVRIIVHCVYGTVKGKSCHNFFKNFAFPKSMQEEEE